MFEALADPVRLVQSVGFDHSAFHPTSFAFSLRPVPKEWKAYTSDDSHFPIYTITAPNAKVADVRNFIGGIKAEHYIVIAEIDGFIVLCMSRHKKGEQPLVLVLKSKDDYDRVVRVFQTQNFTSDVLSAHFAINQSIELLKSDSGDGLFVNRGLFSNYFIRERLKGTLGDRKRSPTKEASSFFAHFGDGGIPSDFGGISAILKALGYGVTSNSQEYVLSSGSMSLDVVAIASNASNLDVMKNDDKTVPAYQAVGALKRYPWVILTNGKTWRLYSSRTSSASTNYFEVDIGGITDEKDPKLELFASLFGAGSFITKDGKTDLDLVLEGGEQYAESLEENLQAKVFDGDLFLDLVRAILDHKNSKKYEEEELSKAKKEALKLLYRLLFILYAESRKLLPVENQQYMQVSLGSVRERLAAMEKEPDSQSAWKALRRLFKAISEGDASINMPQYNGGLFELDPELDKLEISNKYLVPALRALMEIDGKGIDYQNLSVRHLGSLYESLLEYSVKQADTEVALVKGEYLNMSFTKDLEGKYDSIIDKGDIYLSVGGLARKGTGSYYTPEKLVRFLVKKGLEPIFADRETKFAQELEKWRKTGDVKAAELTTKHLLDIQVVDPAMGSGHFLVAAVDEITMWIVALLDRNPDAPLAKEIGEDRQRIIDEQVAKGIQLDAELLTFNVILKRMVMKRCVYGVDINDLAVELAKLSLWLDSFTIGTPLTFLDHHIRAGDSLVGMWISDLKSKKSHISSLDAWMGSVESMGEVMQSISNPADLNIKEIRKSKENYEKFREKSRRRRALLSMKTAALMDDDLEKSLSNDLRMFEEALKKNNSSQITWSAPMKEAMAYADIYRFFHWELEFPDAFSDERRGFDLVVMNPPWEAVKPEDDDFFSGHHPGFRKLKTKSEKEKIKEKLLKNKAIQSEYRRYIEDIGKRVSFYKNSGHFVQRGSGDTDTWKLFLERTLSLLAPEGILSVVLPSGIVTKEGAKLLRAALLERQIYCLYEFENKRGIFPGVHKSYKFALIVCGNEHALTEFPAAFSLYDADALESKVNDDRFLKMTPAFIKRISPTSLTIPELRGIKELKLFEKIYHNHPLLSQGIDSGRWTFAFVAELHRTNASKIFDPDCKGWDLIEGKNFHQFIPNYEKVTIRVQPNKGLDWTRRIREYGVLYKEIHEVPRLAFRDVAAATNVRSMIASILPRHCFNANTAPLVIPRFNGQLLLDDRYLGIICYMAGIMNSTTFDFLIRRRVDTHLNFFYLEQTPIPSRIDGWQGQEIIKISARLSACDKDFESVADACNVNGGPLSMEERIGLMARLDSLVAYHYGLNREEYEYVLSTFEGFEEDGALGGLIKVEWDDSLIRKFNGEVRKRALKCYDEILHQSKGVKCL